MAIVDFNMLAPVNEKIISDITLILRGQGHRFTGALERSIKPVIDRVSGDSIKLGATALDYIFDLEEGLPPGDPKFSNVDMAKLQKWVIAKQNEGHISKLFKPEQAAKAIVKKWKKLGYELPGALKYADPEIGQVDKAIELAFSLSDQEYYKMIDDKVFQMFDDEFHRIKSETIKG